MNDLKTLITALETEKAELLRLIDEAVEEKEFLSAHFHFEALRLINKQLQTLNNLNDKLYDKKVSLTLRIENLRKQLKTEKSEHSRAKIANYITDTEKELKDLNQHPQKNRSDNNDNQLRNHLVQFVSGRISGLCIRFDKMDNLLIEIRRSKSGTKLSLLDVNKLRADYRLTDTMLLKLNGLGFSLNYKKTKMSAILNRSNGEMTNEIMKVISIIIFEVFYIKQLGSQATIEIITNKARR